nr:MAG TPA: hypothetical protein [Caudoviricetes sp.]
MGITVNYGNQKHHEKKLWDTYSNLIFCVLKGEEYGFRKRNERRR